MKKFIFTELTGLSNKWLVYITKKLIKQIDSNKKHAIDTSFVIMQ